MLTVGAGECVYSHLSLLFSFFISLGDVPIYTEILPQRPVRPKTTNRGRGVSRRRCDWKKISRYALLGFPYISSYIKFQVFSSSGLLVLKQTKGVTERKGT